MAQQFIDLKIEYGDIVIENGTEVLVSDRDSIVQDIRHAILESGVLIDMIGNRSAEQRQQKINQLIEYLETDPRIIPGSIKVTIVDINTVELFADTILGRLSIIEPGEG